MRTAIPIVALALAIAGCGGGGGDRPAAGTGTDTTAASPRGRVLTATQYRRDANALCRRAEKESDEAVPGLDQIDDPDDFLDALELRYVKLSRRYDRLFRELSPPPELRRPHDRAVAFAEQDLKLMRRFFDRLREADEEDLPQALDRELRALVPQIERGNRLSRALGMKDCVLDPAELFLEPAPERSS